MKKILGLLSLIALVVGVIAMTPAKQTDIVDHNGIHVGDTAPDFKLQNVDGNWYTLDDVKDADGNTPKGIILVFTCNTCPFSVLYEDRLIDLHNKMAPKGYPVVAIMPNDISIRPGDNMDGMKQRAEEKKFPFLYLMDSDQSVFPKYGATRTPEIYLLDGNKKLRYTGALDDNAREPGSVSVNYVETAVKAIEGGKDPDPVKVKAIGCSIKVKS